MNVKVKVDLCKIFGMIYVSMVSTADEMFNVIKCKMYVMLMNYIEFVNFFRVFMVEKKCEFNVKIIKF